MATGTALEQALHATDERYRDIFDTAADVMVLRDASFRVVDVNAAFLAMTGFSREEALGKDSVLGGTPGELEALVRERHRRALAGEPAVIETQRVRKDGSRVDVELRCMPVQHLGRAHVLYIIRDIGERKRAEEALRASEEQYRSIFNAAEDAIVLRDAAFRVVDVNAAFLALSGYSREEVLGLDRVITSPRDTQPLIRALHERALAGEPVRVEVPRVRKDGTGSEIELRGVPVRYRGEPHVLYIGRDISERKRAEEALRKSEEQYRSIFNASQDTMVLRDADFRVVDVNSAYVSVTGFSREESVGQDRILGNDPPQFEQHLRAQHHRVLAGETMVLETERVRRDGRREQRELRAVPVLHQGKPHVLYIGRDISERKRTEEALRASEEQYRAIFNAATDALILRDPEGRVVDVNPAFLALSGYAREEVIGQQRWIFAGPDAAPFARAMFDRVIAGESVHFELQGLRKDGSRFEVEMHAVPMPYRGSAHVLGMARDITARRRAEAERTQLEAQLRQAHKMEAIGHLTGGIAHDFNNILTGIQGYSRLAAERPAAAADPKLAGYLEQLGLACNRARELIQQMLVFSRGRRGAPRAVALAPLVRQAIRLLRPSLPSTLEIVAQLPPELPAALLDPVQAEQVLMNLCINARDAMESKGTIRVSLARAEPRDAVCASCRARFGGRFVELGVADTGGGVAPEVMERMFEPFFTTKEAGRGSGMGLSIVHGIVHEYGGHLLVHSGPAGSRFRVLFPELAQSAAEEAPPRTQAPARPRLSGRVLVVDDEDMVADFMRELLHGWGLEVTAVGAAAEAREIFGENPQRFDLVLTDHAMPRMTGLELARALRTVRPGLPVILYSGYTDVVPEAQLRQAELELLQKPIDEAALFAVLRRYL